jgi:hypothetical protein
MQVFVRLVAPICAALLLSISPSAEAAGTGSAADLLRASQDQFSGIDGNFLVWRDGTRMPILDGKGDKDFETLLNDPDIDDMFRMPYRPGPPTSVPALNEDPGRVRYEPLFMKMYGDCKKGKVPMRAVAWMPSHRGGSVKFTTVNGAADHLEAVIRDLERLPADYTKYLVPSTGTYNCRTIANTNRRSMHAYGAAIDINTRFTNYWLWAKPAGESIPYRNQIPFQIVDIFERHGFIWGGKWYHYDTMHFEYRPELLGETTD